VSKFLSVTCELLLSICYKESIRKIKKNCDSVAIGSTKPLGSEEATLAGNFRREKGRRCIV